MYGPSSVIRDSHRPIWDYTFPQPITWKLGDPITIRIIDYDWSASEVYILHSRQGDPLAMRLLSGTIKPAKGGKTTLVFSLRLRDAQAHRAGVSQILVCRVLCEHRIQRPDGTGAHRAPLRTPRPDNPEIARPAS